MISFSVIIPAHNAEKTIRKCLLSVFSQDLIPKELIIVNDNSTDATKNVVVEMINENLLPIKCIFIENTLNLGPGESRNLALNKANGDFVCFLDADDYFYKNKLSVLSEQIKKLDYIVEILAHPINKRLKKSIGRINIFSSIISNGIETTSAVCMRNRKEYRFPNKRYCEDAYLWLTIMSKHASCYLLNEYLAGSDSKRDFKKGLSSKIFSMYINTLDNYASLYKNKMINVSCFILFSCISTLKFLVRVFRFKFISAIRHYVSKIMVNNNS